MKNILKVVSILIACAMAAALTILPAPVAAASPDDTSQEWKVKLTVLDDQNQPLSGALAQCTSVMVWNAGNPIRFNAKMTQITDDKGEAEFDFHDDTRLKTAICAALKEPVVPDENAGSDANGAEHPSYQPKAVALVSPPLPGQEYEVALKLTERGDPGNSEDASVAPSQ